MRVHIACSSAIVLAMIALPHAQRPRPTFHAEIDYVEFPVRVIDSAGNLVRDLSQSDFQIFEDGKPQTIETFRRVEPSPQASTAPGGAVSPHDITNPAELAQATGQIYLFVFDDHHLGAEDSAAARRVVEQFIRSHFTENDRAAIMLASGGGIDFTGDRERLLSTIQRFAGHKLIDLPPPNAGARAALDKLSQRKRQVRSESLLQTLLQASTWLQGVHGRRKVLFLITNEAGCNVVPETARSFQDPCGGSLADALRAAQIADVSIYPLHTHGLDVPENRQAMYAGGAPVAAEGITVGNRQRGVFSALSILATETGGFMIADTNNFEGAFGRVARENSFYYLVGYYSTNDNHNGKFRKNEVRLARKDVRALYRPGYMAPKAP